MRMPGGACTRLEANPGRADARWVGGLNDRILPDGPGETWGSHSARGTRSTSNDVHVDFSPVGRSVLRLTIRMQYFKSDTLDVRMQKARRCRRASIQCQFPLKLRPAANCRRPVCRA